MTAPAIRPYAPQDRPAVVGLLLELNRHEASVGAPRRTDLAGAEACLVADEANASAGGAQFVLVTEGEIVGYLACYWPAPPPYVPASDRPILHIENIVVTAARRRSGYGRMLLAHAEDLARSRKARAITLTAVVNNESALRTYSSAGFITDSFEMTKSLDEGIGAVVAPIAIP